MIIYGYNITLSGATVLLAAFTAVSAIFTAIAARHTKKLAQYNKVMITQSEKQHREALRPLCVPTTTTGIAIARFDKVIGPYNVLVRDGLKTTETNGTPTLHLHLVNKGLGPAVNVRLHINNINNQRITKDFMVAHALPPGETCRLLSEIPPLNMNDGSGKLVFGMPPGQIVNDAYFIICEYESMFSGDAYHSTVAKGYRDPSLAGDGKNQWRLNRPLIPPVEFRPGLDASKPIWPLPPEDANYPAEFLNLPSQPEQGQPN
ncbi:hypothetical protein BBC27_00180 [Acidithiobacillus ferrivorans]|uniref:Uncharacterized protein n=1 Tax=Acidithiobacillus ferrivorans TaxID=160808 RepID=A0A1B9C202_9PROT|nr:hypothetical protein [Acidithiobacillus ferrivorans]OCB04006.1 hypothetical protein BBC27_00180 [Acidithiobacillus ferrivorans]